MTMKPDWSDAPEWATHLAMDEDGRWYWYERKPVIGYFAWRTEGAYDADSNRYLIADTPRGRWQHTLEARPTSASIGGDEMANQAAQTMPELPDSQYRGGNDVFGKEFPLYTADQMHQYARDYAASQTAGEGVYGLLKAIRYNAENGSQDRPLHDRLRMIARDANEAIGRMDRAMLAAAPAASGGECAALHPATDDLVRRFSDALRAKLAAAEMKYGYSDGWASPDWMDECRKHLMQHIAKGDPRDVAAYCAFLWHHGESTAQNPQSIEPVNERLREFWLGRCRTDSDERGYALLSGGASEAKYLRDRCGWDEVIKVREVAAVTQAMLDAGTAAMIDFRKSGDDWTDKPAHAAGVVIRAALEQALTQQRVCPACASATESYCCACGWASVESTPQPGAEALRELVRKWRELSVSMPLRSYTGATLDKCADELESLLSAASGEKGVG